MHNRMHSEMVRDVSAECIRAKWRRTGRAEGAGGIAVRKGPDGAAERWNRRAGGGQARVVGGGDRSYSFVPLHNSGRLTAVVDEFPSSPIGRCSYLVLPVCRPRGGPDNAAYAQR